MKLRQQYVRFFTLMLLCIGITFLSSIVINLIIARKQAPIPQAIFTLGGGKIREEFTAQFARYYPTLPIWVSSGQPKAQARQIFQDAGIDLQRVHLDYRAVDTVTNFTSLAKDFKHQNYQHIFLITSDFHMTRAKAIAFIVLGSQGVAFTAVAIPTDKPPEPKAKIIRDTGRAFLWLFTKRTGSSLKDP